MFDLHSLLYLMDLNLLCAFHNIALIIEMTTFDLFVHFVLRLLERLFHFVCASLMMEGFAHHTLTKQCFLTFCFLPTFHYVNVFPSFLHCVRLILLFLAPWPTVCLFSYLFVLTLLFLFSCPPAPPLLTFAFVTFAYCDDQLFSNLFG